MVGGANTAALSIKFRKGEKSMYIIRAAVKTADEHKKRHENLAKIVADLREALDQRDERIAELEEEVMLERRARVRIADQYLELKKHSIRVPNIVFDVYTRR